MAMTPRSSSAPSSRPPPLFELEHDLGEHILAKPVLPAGLHAGHTRLVNGIIRLLKGQAVDDHQRERLPWNVHPFPERLDPAEDGIADSFEAAHEFGAWQLPLAQER